MKYILVLIIFVQATNAFALVFHPKNAAKCVCSKSEAETLKSCRVFCADKEALSHPEDHAQTREASGKDDSN